MKYQGAPPPINRKARKETQVGFNTKRDLKVSTLPETDKSLRITNDVKGLCD